MQSEKLVEEFSRLVREYKQDDGPGGIEAWNLIADFAVDNAEAIEAALSAAEPQPAPSVAVRALEWEEGEGGLKGQYVWSSGDPWVFLIVKNPDNPDYVWFENFGLEGWDPCSPVRGAFPTLEEAKAAAQADYEARIRSALSAQVQDASARMENGLDWFIEAVFIDEQQRKRSGRLKFLPNGQPYYEGDLTPKEFMKVFLYGAFPSAEKTWPFSLPDALPLDGFGDGERNGMYSGVQIGKPAKQEG